MSDIAVPCQHCGKELYDRVVWDGQPTSPPRCPDCGGDVSAEDDAPCLPGFEPEPSRGEYPG